MISGVAIRQEDSDRGSSGGRGRDIPYALVAAAAAIGAGITGYLTVVGNAVPQKLLHYQFVSVCWRPSCLACWHRRRIPNSWQSYNPHLKRSIKHGMYKNTSCYRLTDQGEGLFIIMFQVQGACMASLYHSLS